MADISSDIGSDNKKKKNEFRSSEIDRLKTSLSKEDKLNRNLDNQIDHILSELENQFIIVNRFDYYGNSIPLGAFCYAIPFILLGFYELDIFDKPDEFIFFVFLFFGGLGQVTAGIFEYIKSRTFPTIFYLLYGVYFISYFFLNYKYSTDPIYVDKFSDYLKVFYASWAALSFPIFLGSIRTNIIYLVQNLTACGFFVVKCIGESRDIGVLREKVAGILELITGFASIYLCFSQIINEHFKKNILPTFKLKADNEIDIL